MKLRFLRYWTYFRRGHATYLAFFMSFANFILIQYRFLVMYVSFLDAIFSSLTAFTITFFVVYLPIATILGWLDYKKFAVPMDSTIAAQASPWVRDLAKSLMMICDGKNGEAKEILLKWVEP
jgi:hypothetical protein